MAEYTSLTDSEVRETATAYFSARQAKSISQEHPTIVLVGGQPGAGKSAAASLVKTELSLQGGYVHVDADRMRERIRVNDSQPSSEQTQADAGRLVTMLRDQAVQGRRNIVEEGTFRGADGAIKFVKGLQDRGYRVELFAVATPREESLLGIYQRHELQHAAGSANPRFVSEKYHDEAMQGFEGTLAKTAKQLDRVRVADRSGAVLFDSAVQTNRQANASQALLFGRALTDNKLAEIANAWGAIEAIARHRHAPSDYLAAVGGHAHRLEGMVKDRIHEHAMASLKAHAPALERDGRFGQHTEGELARAAYFRGSHEKVSALKGVAADFAKFDAGAANRELLRQLPQVSNLAGRASPRAQRPNEDRSR